MGTRGRRRTSWNQAVLLDETALLSYPNVERVATGWKERDGLVTRRYSVKIYVREKQENPAEGAWLPRTARVLVPAGKGLYRVRRIPTDVVWYAPASFCALPTDLMNPVLSGGELGAQASNVGTYACMVRDSAGQTFALTAGHVVSGGTGPVTTGLTVRQPVSFSPGISPDDAVLGKTAGGTIGNGLDGFVDFALIKLTNGRTGSSAALDALTITGEILPPDLAESRRVEVTKFGATTRRTNAVFSRMVKSEVVDGMTVRNVLEFKAVSSQPFGLKGDSGALVVSVESASRGTVVGLLFAATPPTPDAPGGRGFVFPFGRMAGFQFV